MKVIGCHASSFDFRTLSGLMPAPDSVTTFWISLTEVFGMEQPPAIGSLVVFKKKVSELVADFHGHPIKGTMTFRVEGIEYRDTDPHVAFVILNLDACSLDDKDAAAFFTHGWCRK